MTEIDPKLSRLYREAATEGPPAAVDAAVLAAARRQAAQPRRRERSSWVRWMAPASAIATLVLGVSIALLIERERPETLDGTAIREVPQRPQGQPAARATESVKPKADAGTAPAAAVKKEASPITSPAQAPVPLSPEQAPALSAPAPQSAEPAATATQAFPAESRAKATATETSTRKAATEFNAARDSAAGGMGAAAPAVPAAAGKLAPMRQPEVRRSPEAWLDEINRLKREGRDQEAAEQLTAFRKAYPAHAVPEDLLK